jgi:hypothetical protein
MGLSLSGPFLSEEGPGQEAQAACSENSPYPDPHPQEGYCCTG